MIHGTAALRYALFASALALSAVPGLQAQTLRIGQIYVPNSVDPHFYNGTPTKTLSEHLFDRLVEQAPDTQLRPGLAESWRPIADDVWEFRLRPNVTFINGQRLTSDDVAFTLERARNVPNSPGGFSGTLRLVKSVEIVDDLTFRIHTPGPAPTLPNDLANVAIISRAVGANATTQDYNAGTAAIGTGPYRLVSFSHGEGVELERNEAWWGAKPEWQRVTVRFIPGSAARSAALLSGSVDLIDQPAPNDLPSFQSDQRFTVSEHVSTRMVYLAPDQYRAESSPLLTDAQGRVLSPNPLRDRRVREALSIAINREAIASRILAGTGTPTGQWMPAGAYSYNPAVPSPPYDPDRARRLLAEAGYASGFRMILHAPTDIRPTDPIVAQAIGQMWTRIGVTTQIETIPNSVFAARATQRQLSMGLWSWGSNSGEGGYMLVNVLNTISRERSTGNYNRAGYSNPALDSLTERAMATLDDAARERLLMEAVTMAMGDVAVIPLYQMNNFWVTRRGLTYEASAHDRTLAMLVRTTR